MRHSLCSIILALTLGTILGNCALSPSQSSTTDAELRHDTITITSHPKGGSIVSGYNADFPPEYFTVPLAEVLDTQYLSMLKSIVDTSFRTVNDVMKVSLHTCDWNMVRRFEAIRDNPDATMKEKYALSHDILRPLTSMKYADDCVIEFCSTSMRDIQDRINYALVIVDSLPMLLPRQFEGELFKIVGKVTYKYPSGYIKYVYDSGLALFEYPRPNTFYEVKGNKIKRINKDSMFITILYADDFWYLR